MIEAGLKPYEYREIKPFWIKRLCKRYPNSVIIGGDLIDKHKGTNYDIIKFDAVQLYRAYASQTMTWEVENIDIGKAIPELSDNWEGDVFRIKLGKLIFKTN